MEAAEQVELLRTQCEAIMGVLNRAPRLSPVTVAGSEEGSRVDSLGRDLPLLSAVWAELFAIETVVGDASGRFEHEEPIHPETRRLLDEVGDGVVALWKQLQRWSTDFALTEEPDQRVVELLTRIVERQAKG